MVMGGKLFQLSFYFVFTVALSACGGGGGSNDVSSGVSNDVTSNTPQKITEENYEMVAQLAFSILGSSDSPDDVGSRSSKSVRSSLLESMAVTEAGCDSGSGTENDSFQVPGEISDGDSFDSIHNNCKNFSFGGGYSLSDGRHKANFKITGDYLGGGDGTYFVKSEYASRLNEFYMPPEPSFSLVFDGSLTYDAERKDGLNLNRWKQVYDEFSIETKENGVVDWFTQMTGYTEWIDNISEGTYSLKSDYDLLFENHPSGPTFLVKVESDFTGFLDLFEFNSRAIPTGGTGKIFDKNSSAIVTVTVTDDMAVIECDIDGDGVAEFTKTVDAEDTLFL